ncbi:hypothetical protein Tco_1184099 [Tanacetum coccineum]
MESLYGFRSIHGANCTVDIDIEMTRHREEVEVEEEKWWSCGGGGVAHYYTNWFFPRNDEISPFDLANAGIDLNQPLEEEVMVTGSCATDEYLSFYNVDPAKVERGRYVDCMRFLNAPEYVYLDCYIKGYTVGVQFWQELVPLLCKGGYYEHQKLSEVGWLSDDELLDGIIAVPTLHEDDVDILSYIKATLSKWTSLLNVMLLKDGHFQRTRRLPYNFKLVYNDGFCFPIPRQRNFSDCGVVTGWVIESLCSDMTPVVDGDPNIFFSVVRVNMASRFYDCRCEDTSQCGYD